MEKRPIIGYVVVLLVTLSPLLLYYHGTYTNAYAQNDTSKSSDIPGNAVNSKYLGITDHRYRQGEFGSDTITGTIVNNSTQDIQFASVYAALYDKDNTLITVESGSVSRHLQ